MSLITFDDKVDSNLNPNPAINKVVADDMNQLKNGVNYFYDSQGFIIYSDTIDTEESSQVLPLGIDTNITIVDPSPNRGQAPIELGSGNLWVGNKITPMAIGDAYIIRIDFKAKIDSANGYFDLKIDINGAIGDIFQKVLTFPKGRLLEEGFSTTSLIYTLDTFIANNGNIQIKPNAEMFIYDKSITIHRVYKGR